MSRTNWYKGKSEVEPPAALPQEYDAHSNSQRGMEDDAPSSHQGGPQSESNNDAPSTAAREKPASREKRERDIVKRGVR